MQAFDSFGEWVRRRRKALDMTQADLAGRVGCALVTLKKIERDERRPSRQMAERLAQCLELAPAEFPVFLAVAARRRAADFLPASNQPILHRGNLPAPVTSLVGREIELATITAELSRSGVRLLTLTGPVGVGKTRLAIEAGWRLQPKFSDGVYLVSLGAIHEADMLPAVTAAVLEIKDSRGQNLAQSMVDYLARKELLLIFDNLEHLQPAAIFLSDWLAAAPRLKVLVASRACLHLYGEHELAVAPLPLPEAAYPAEDAPAVRLFCECARAARADFRLTAELTPIVSDIVHRLDGLPLAIELAAARIKHFSPAELQQRLERRLPLLGGGPANMPPRLQGIEKAIAWSYDLLPPAERTLMNRLAVFLGGFSIPAAEAVCRFPFNEPVFSTGRIVSLALSGIAGGVADLLDQSLLRRQTDAEETRFQMLDIIREYALEKLQESGETELMKQRHAEYFTGWAEQAEQQLWGPEQTGWLARMEQEGDNLRAALAWLLSNQQAEWAERLAVALGVFWMRRGQYSEGRAWLERVMLQQERLDAPANRRAWTQRTAATLAYRQGDWSAAQKWLAECLPVFQAGGDRAGVAGVLFDLGWIAIDQGDWSRARALNLESLALSTELDDLRGIYHALTNLGCTELCAGAREQASQLFAQAYSAAQELGHIRGLAVNLANMGWVAFYQGDLDLASRRSQESIQYSLALDDKEVLAECLEILVIVAAEQGEYTRAAQLSGATQSLWDDLHISRPLTQHSAAANQKAVDTLRRSLPEPVFMAQFHAGQAMNPDALAAIAPK